MIPRQVRLAVKLGWLSLGLAMLTSTASRLLGHIGNDQLCGELLTYAALCVLPYKLRKGSNSARVTFMVLTALSLVWLANGGYASLSTFELVADTLQLPLTAFTVVLLLRRDVSWWFRAGRERCQVPRSIEAGSTD